MPGSGATLSRPLRNKEEVIMDRVADEASHPGSLVVRSGAGIGELFLQDSNVVFQLKEETGSGPFNLATCCGGSGTQVIPLSEVVGASLETNNGLRIWHCAPSHVGSGAGAKTHYKLNKSQKYECSSRAAAEAFVSQVQRVASWRGKDSPPRVVAVVNPHSGKGAGRTVFSQQVLPLLRDAAGMSVEVHMTQSPKHATQIVKGLPMDQVDLLLYVGGDGTVFEGMQGLYSRPDWAAAARVPFATVPTGSGNGLAASLGIFDPVSAAYTAVKGNSHPLDVASVLQPPSSRYFLVLSVAYGLMSNLDIGTEHLRWMGEARFTVGGLREVLRGTCYPLRAAFWPANEPAPTSSTTLRSSGSSGGAAGQGGTDASGVRVQPKAQQGEGGQESPHASLLGTGAHKARLSSSGTAAEAAAAEQQAQPLQLGPPLERSGIDVSSLPPGPPLPILSQLGRLPPHLPQQASELPPGWRMLPEQAGQAAQYFMLHNTQYLALNARMNPKGQLSDGAWELIYVSGLKGMEGRVQGMNVLLNSESGDHVDLECVKTEKVRALMFEPLAGDTTWTVLDGEAVPNVPLYLEVHEKAANALAAPGWQDRPFR